MRVALIDSNFLCYRAKLTTGHFAHEGTRTGVVFGFFNQLIKIAEKIDPDQFVFFWDSKHSKRKEILPTYKEKRRQNLTEEEELEWKIAFAQFTQLRRKILPQIGFNNNFLQKGYESDDLLAQYVFSKNYDDQEKYIITADDDLLQLLNHCKIYNPAKDAVTTEEKFEKEYGINPKNWGLVKQIAGCSSDNVPGIENVGEKTAIKYIRGELKRTHKTYEKIKNSEEVIERNKELVVLPFKGTKEVSLKNDGFKMAEFLRLCRQFGMNSFRQEDKKEKIRSLFERS